MPESGELWFLSAFDDEGPNALVCVLSPIPQLPGRLLVAFADTETETATDQHLCYERGVAARWPIRIALDATAAISESRFVVCVGAVPNDGGDLVRASRDQVFSPSLEARRGLSLHGPHDTRLAVIDEQIDLIWWHWLEE